MRKSLFALAAAATPVRRCCQAQSANYAIDPTHTFALFEISHFQLSELWCFDKKKAPSFDDKEGRDQDVTRHGHACCKHLQSADLFDAAKHPTMKFVSSTATRSPAWKASSRCWARPVTLKANQFNCYDSPMLGAKCAAATLKPPSTAPT